MIKSNSSISKTICSITQQSLSTPKLSMIKSTSLSELTDDKEMNYNPFYFIIIQQYLKYSRHHPLSEIAFLDDFTCANDLSRAKFMMGIISVDNIEGTSIIISNLCFNISDLIFDNAVLNALFCSLLSATCHRLVL